MKPVLLAALFALPVLAWAQNEPEDIKIVEISNTPESIAELQETVKIGSNDICIEAGNSEQSCTCFSSALIKKYPSNYLALLSDPDTTNEEIKDFIDWISTKPCQVNYPLYDAATGKRYFLE